MGRVLDIPTAPVFEPLLALDLRYLAAHGGRGSAKSRFFAGRLVEECVAVPGTHAVCIREVQKSLAQSAKRNIEISARALEVGGLFDPRKTEIVTPGGGLIIFQGMQNHTAESIKSLEGYRIAWVEEGQTLSASSLRMLRPTLRRPDSQLWFSWNPRFPNDPVDDFFRGNNPERKEGWEKPPRAAIVQSNWMDNPWFHETTLVEEKDFDYRRDRETYDHVWLGGYERNSEARVFKNWRVDWFDIAEFGNVRLLGGADWGFSIDPTVLVLCFIVGRMLYIWREVWQIGCEIDRTPALFDMIDPEWTQGRARDPSYKSLARKVPIVADSARPETISYMQRNGFPRIQAAIKGPGSVEDGITFLKSYDIVIHPDCTHVAAEFARYSYKIDKKTDTVTSDLADDHNHTIDSVRYALESVRRGGMATVRELQM